MPPRPESRPELRPKSHPKARPAAPAVKPGLRGTVFAAGLTALVASAAAFWLGGADLWMPATGFLCMGVGLLWLVLRPQRAAPAPHTGRAGESLTTSVPPVLAATPVAPLSATVSTPAAPGTTPSAEQLNAALCAYVATFPSADRLRAHLEANGLTAQAEQFEKELKGAVRVAESFIYAAAGKEKWDAAFNERFFQAVASQHPWLTRESFKRLGSFGQYLNWHDGLEL